MSFLSQIVNSFAKDLKVTEAEVNVSACAVFRKNLDFVTLVGSDGEIIVHWDYCEWHIVWKEPLYWNKKDYSDEICAFFVFLGGKFEILIYFLQIFPRQLFC